MALQASTRLRNAIANAVEATLGPSAKLQIRTSAQPADCAAGDTGTLLVEIDVPSDFLSAGSGGAVAKIGTWADNAVALGNQGHFRFKDSTGVFTDLQGSITVTGGGGDMTTDALAVVVGQLVSVSGFTITTGNA